MHAWSAWCAMRAFSTRAVMASLAVVDEHVCNVHKYTWDGGGCRPVLLLYSTVQNPITRHASTFTAVRRRHTRGCRRQRSPTTVLERVSGATPCAVAFVRLRLTAQMGCLRHPSTPRGSFCRPERCLATSCRARWTNRPVPVPVNITQGSSVPQWLATFPVLVTVESLT